MARPQVQFDANSRLAKLQSNVQKDDVPVHGPCLAPQGKGRRHSDQVRNDDAEILYVQGSQY